MKSRIVFVFVVIALMLSVLLVRAFVLQVLPSDNLSKLRNKQFETVVKLEPRRGDIVDRKGKELAASVTSFSLYADPKLVKMPKRLSSRLAKVTDHTYRELLQKLSQKNKRFVWLSRRLSPETKAKIESWKESGIGFVEEGKRIYPNEGLLSQTLGFVGREGQGLEGLEARFEQELKGEKKQFSVRRDAFGRPLVSNGQLFTERPGGATLQLTIDSDLQYFLEQELMRALELHEAERAMGVVLDAQTSEVLAMAGVPTFNSNEVAESTPELRRNPIIMDAFEHGSTIKTFTIAAALREGIAQPNTKYYCEKGKMKVDNRWIRESDKKHEWEWLTVSEILEVSSNIGVTKMAFEMGQEKLRAAFLDFGFGERTGIEMNGETRGILPALPWRKHHFSNISFGHGLALSPLQIANAYAAIANGGVLKTPTLVKGLVNSDTGEVISNQSRPERRVLTPTQAGIMRLMLTGATSQFGTGTKARVPGFIVAGKTGTAQKVDPNGRGYMRGKYISSFAGFVPANEPKFVIFIAVDSAQKGYYGSDVAAPSFNKVAEYALRAWGITPSILAEENVLVSKKTAPKIEALRGERLTVMPSLKGLTVREVSEMLRGQDLEIDIKGRGVVFNTWPKEGESIPENFRKIKLQLLPERD